MDIERTTDMATRSQIRRPARASSTARPARQRRRIQMLAGVGLVLLTLLGWLGRAAWLHPWSLVSVAMRGPLPPGKLLVSAQTSPARDGGTRNGVHKFEPAGGAIVLVDLRDGTAEALVERVAGDARLSPDGRVLAYNTDEREVWIYRLGSAEPEIIPALRGIPVWMPDGSLVCTHSPNLVHATDRVGPTYRVTFDGQERTVLPVPESDEVHDVSPDGRWLVTHSGRLTGQGKGFHIYLIAADGSEQRALTGEGSNLFPRFSPDGRYVVFTKARGKVSDICRVDLDGTGLVTLITGLPADAKAAFTPDGTHLLVHDSAGITLRDATGGRPRRIPVWSRLLKLPLLVDPLFLGAAEWVNR